MHGDTNDHCKKNVSKAGQVCEAAVKPVAATLTKRGYLFLVPFSLCYVHTRVSRELPAKCREREREDEADEKGKPVYSLSFTFSLASGTCFGVMRFVQCYRLIKEQTTCQIFYRARIDVG